MPKAHQLRIEAANAYINQEVDEMMLANDVDIEERERELDYIAYHIDYIAYHNSTLVPFGWDYA